MKAITSEKLSPKDKVTITREHLEYFQDGIKSRDAKIRELRDGIRDMALGVDAIMLEVALKLGTVAEGGTITVELPMPDVEKLKEYSMCAENLDGSYIITAALKPNEEPEAEKEEEPCEKSE